MKEAARKRSCVLQGSSQIGKMKSTESRLEALGAIRRAESIDWGNSGDSEDILGKFVFALFESGSLTLATLPTAANPPDSVSWCRNHRDQVPYLAGNMP